MLVISGTFEVPPGTEAVTIEALTVMARASRAEKGCIKYAFWQNVEDATQFRVYEEWEDMDCLKAHGASEHMAAYRARMADIGTSGRDISLFEPGKITKL